MTSYQEGVSVPTLGQIEKEAYARWERRGRSHGSDREDWIAAELDLTYTLNYRPIARIEFGNSVTVLVGAQQPKRCRFCEQPIASNSSSRCAPIPSFLGEASVASTDICDECDQSFRSDLEPGLRLFWGMLPELIADRPATLPIPLVPFKALTWLALAIMPEAELEYFPDALEWVINPDHDEDSAIFSRFACLGYSLSQFTINGWAGVDKSRDEDAPFPSWLYFLASGNLIIQFPVPLSVHEQESDGEETRLLRRSWTLIGATALGASRLLSPSLP